jgi:hypothetical protein
VCILSELSLKSPPLLTPRAICHGGSNIQRNSREPCKLYLPSSIVSRKGQTNKTHTHKGNLQNKEASEWSLDIWHHHKGRWARINNVKRQRSRRILSSFCSGAVEIIPPFLFLRRQRRWIHFEVAACQIGSHFAIQLPIICSLQISSQYERNFKWSYSHNKTLQTIALFRKPITQTPENKD